jgi:hypothetical protein
MQKCSTEPLSHTSKFLAKANTCVNGIWQIELQIEKSALINKLGDLPIEPDQTLLVPIMWFDNEIDRPPTNLLILLGDALSTGDNISRGVLIFSTILLSVQVSISPTFYALLFRTEVLREAFLNLHFRFELLLAKEYWRKCAYKMLAKLTTGVNFVL